MKRQNIVMIMTDQQRFDWLSGNGCAAIDTPNLDRMMAEGVTFENTYVTCPLCTPSRASIFTGKDLPGHGVYRLHDVLPQEEVLFPSLLRQQGYTTALVGKLHVSGRFFERENRNRGDGFDIYEMCLDPVLDLDAPYQAYGKFLKEQFPAVYTQVKAQGKQFRHFPKEAHMSTWVGTRAGELIREHDYGSAPLFLLASMFDPHDPYYDYPLEMEKAVRKDALPDRQLLRDAPPVGPRLEGQKFYRQDGTPMDEDALQSIRVGYLASIKLIDEQVGRIAAAVKAAGQYENTAFFFVSDHGDMVGDRDLLGKGCFFYDPCVKVPMIMRLPDPAWNVGEKSALLVQPHDLAATILGIAGVEPGTITGAMPTSMDLRKLLTGTISPRTYVVTQFPSSGYNCRSRYYDPPLLGTMLRTERFKLSLYHRCGQDEPYPGELYNMEQDPLEEHNLWDNPAYQGEKCRLLSMLADWMTQQQLRYLGSRGGEITPWTVGESSFAMVT